MLLQPFRKDGRPMLALWAVVQAALLGSALTTGDWPWRMFAAPAVHRPEVLAEARIGEGPWQPLVVDDAFHYTRGWTDLRVHDEAKVLFDGRPHPKARGDFARWLVAELAPDAGYTEVRLRLSKPTARGGPPRVTGLGRFPL